MGRLSALAGTSRGKAVSDGLRRDGRYLLLCGTALALAVISLSPLLGNGFNGDDLPNSVTFATSVLHAQGQGLGDLIHTVLASVPGWAQSGRFFPLSAYGVFLFYFVDGHALALKLFVLALILVDLGLLGYLTTQITGSRTLGVLAILITPLLFQFRTGVYHDPITAFSGLLQVVLTCTLISLILLLLYLRSSKRRYLVASLAIYAASMLTYEITTPFFLLFAVLAWLYPERRSLLMSARISWPFAALAGAAVALNMGLRLFFQVAFSGSAAEYAQAASVGGPIARAYIPNLAPGAILETIAHQVSAALPLGFQQLAAPGRWLFPSFSADLAAQPAFYLLLIAGYGAMAVVLGWRLWREVLARSHGFRPGLLCVPVCGLLILPNVLISLSPRYQAETSWGIGYLPVYLSYFGVALLLVALIYGLFRLAASAERSAAFATVTTIALAVGIAYVSVVNHANNGIAVETGNESVWYPRVTVAAAAERGLFTGVPADATIVIDGSEPAWDVAGVPPFFTGQAGVRVTSMVTVAKAVETMRATTPSSTSADGAATYLVSPQSDVYYLTYRSAWRGNGYAMLGRVRELTVAANGAPSMQLEPVRLFMSAAPLSASTPNLLLGPHGQGLPTTSPTELGIDPNDMAMVASGSEWSLFGTIPGGTLSWVP
jgi:hypothetical protein